MPFLRQIKAMIMQFASTVILSFGIKYSRRGLRFNVNVADSNTAITDDLTN